MTCPSCSFDNDPGSRFCEGCGAPLASTCPSCGEPVRSEASFCRSCGTALRPAAASATQARRTAEAATGPAAAPAGEQTERRVVSVLFADLVGFTSLSEDRDPETTRELLTRYFEASREAIERHGGIIEKFIGDAVMAVWGTPTSYEDDAERAVRAAFELVAAVRGLAPELQARAAVMTGDAAVNLGATNQGMVAGDLVNTAARLQGIAEAGSVLVGERTVRAAEAAILFEPLGDHEVKGRLAPVPAWRAVRVVAARGGSLRNDALEAPFVGRDDELRLLKDQLHATGRDQRARLVSIAGPAGIGKSRLVWEFEKYVDGVTEPILWHRGRSPSYGDGITFWALGEMVRRRAGLAEDDDEATTRQRIHDSVVQFVTDAEEQRIVEPALLALLGIEADTAGGRDRLFPAWRIFFERISEQGTTVLVFEDLQWADAGLLEFLDHLLDWSKSRPLLVVTLARPELFDRHPDWGAGRRSLTALALDPLTDADMRRLLDGLVPGLPAATVDTIVGRAEGMPLYAVETVRMLLAEGRIERDGDVYRPVGDLSTLSVPESLRSLIASRLDGLDAADRALLQDAAVIGQVFNTASLAAVTGEDPATLEPRLRWLVRRELLEVEADPASPERGQYKFVQALISEVAYGTLALRDRRSRHLAAARHYEALGDDELAGALASHYLAAYEVSAEGPEADAVAAQARIALRAAADRAVALGGHAQAIAHLERALAITTDAAERAELLERAARAAVHAVTGRAREYARAAVEARREAGDSNGMQRATALLGQVLIDENDFDGALEALSAALADPACDPDPATEAELQVGLSRAYMRLGRGREAMEMAEAALAVAEPHNLERIVADALNHRAAVLANAGRRREAIGLQRVAVDLAQAGGWVDLELRLRNNLAVVVADDAPAESTAISREIIQLAERIGSEFWYAGGVGNFAIGTYLEAHHWDEALEQLERALPRAREGNQAVLRSTYAALRAARGHSVPELMAELEAMPADPHMNWWVDAARADLAAAAGDHAAVEHWARRALGAAEAVGNEVEFTAMVAKASLARHDLDAARAAANELRSGPAQGARSKAFQSLADAGVAALEGRQPDARAGFTAGLDELRRLEQRFEVARWELVALGLLPDAPEAPAWADETRTILEGVGAAAYLAQLDELLAATSRGPGSPVPTTTAEGAPTV